jgi:hypothetical protein
MDTVIFGFSYASILLGIGWVFAFAVGTAFAWLFITVILRSIEFWVALFVTGVVVLLTIYPFGA